MPYAPKIMIGRMIKMNKTTIDVHKITITQAPWSLKIMKVLVIEFPEVHIEVGRPDATLPMKPEGWIKGVVREDFVIDPPDSLCSPRVSVPMVNPRAPLYMRTRRSQ